jgi:hypothetical protein
VLKDPKTGHAEVFLIGHQQHTYHRVSWCLGNWRPYRRVLLLNVVAPHACKRCCRGVHG